MTQKNEQQVIADILDYSRWITMFYVSKLQDADIRKVFSCEGGEFNSAYWLIGHMAWAENDIVLNLVRGKGIQGYPWLDQFALGSKVDAEKLNLANNDLIDAFHKVHAECLDFIRNAPDEVLSEEIDFMGGKRQKRHALYHAVSHESTHSGHLGWICKMMGIKTV